MALNDANTQTKRLNSLAVAAMKAGRFGEARALLEQAVQIDHRQPAIWLNLAAVLRSQNQADQAIKAVDSALTAEPRHFTALLMRASLLERLGRGREAGAAYGTALSQAPPDHLLDPPTRTAVARAREMNGLYARDKHAFLSATIGTAGVSTSHGRSQAFVDLLTGRRRPYRQEPVGYHYPGQPAIEFWDRQEFPWLEAFEARTGAIVSELRAWADGSDERLVPYLDHPDAAPLDQWAELNNSRRWSALHLLNFGRRVEENCHLFPRTLEALALLPQPEVINRSPSAMFSVLAPHTRIPAHTGIANTRLVVHLPLLVPDGCFFRVGNETRPWRVGEAFVFDDTIEHEAWNDSDERRIILICDVWSPRLSPEERVMIAQIMAAMDVFDGVTGSNADNAL